MNDLVDHLTIYKPIEINPEVWDPYFQLVADPVDIVINREDFIYTKKGSFQNSFIVYEKAVPNSRVTDIHDYGIIVKKDKLIRRKKRRKRSLKKWKKQKKRSQNRRKNRQKNQRKNRRKKRRKKSCLNKSKCSYRSRAERKFSRSWRRNNQSS